mmetsp:Transcript_20487/g.36801  ORF Transcript_20487/g.36801 Transcript_20487/m.36801 type:complete len:279 (+) Transcript_20487:1434-2270(+)
MEFLRLCLCIFPLALCQVSEVPQLLKLLFVLLLQLCLFLLNSFFSCLICKIQKLAKLLCFELCFLTLCFCSILTFFELPEGFCVRFVGKRPLLSSSFIRCLAFFQRCFHIVILLLKLDDFVKCLLLNLLLFSCYLFCVSKSLSQNHWPTKCCNKLSDQLCGLCIHSRLGLLDCLDRFSKLLGTAFIHDQILVVRQQLICKRHCIVEDCTSSWIRSSPSILKLPFQCFDFLSPGLCLFQRFVQNILKLLDPLFSAFSSLHGVLELFNPCRTVVSSSQRC